MATLLMVKCFVTFSGKAKRSAWNKMIMSERCELFICELGGRSGFFVTEFHEFASAALRYPMNVFR